MDMITEKVMAYMVLAGVLGFAQDRILLLIETFLMRWKH
jgi:ABC-type nitrate/sulfonate/bicarbonate transport system permease component